MPNLKSAQRPDVLCDGAGDAFQRFAIAALGQHLQRGDGLVEIALDAADGILQAAPLDDLREQFGAAFLAAVENDGMEPFPLEFTLLAVTTPVWPVSVNPDVLEKLMTSPG